MNVVIYLCQIRRIFCASFMQQINGRNKKFLHKILRLVVKYKKLFNANTELLLLWVTRLCDTSSISSLRDFN